jgi:DNA polymerase-3 subunit delta'
VIRDFLIVPAGRTPTGGKGRVFVVLEADLLSEPAQNALLKTLEEPPRGVTIILIASQAESLLPTTLSRCQLVNFFPLPADFVRERLIASGVDAEQAAFWAGYTAGSLGEALRLAGREMYAVKRELLNRLADPEPAAEAALADWLTKTAEALADRLVAEAKEEQKTELSRQLANRRAAATILPMMAGVFRDALTAATGADRALVHADQPQAAITLAGRFSVAELARVIEQLDACEQLLWRNVNPRLIWDNVAVTVASATPLRL